MSVPRCNSRSGHGSRCTKWDGHALSKVPGLQSSVHRGTLRGYPVEWRDPAPTLPEVLRTEPGEHSCHLHPLGAMEFKRYWCGCACVDQPCRKYMFVWLLTHPKKVVRWFRSRSK